MADESVRLGWLQRAARILLYIASISGVVLIIFGIYLVVSQEYVNASVVMLGVGAMLILMCSLGFGIVVALVHLHAELRRTRRAVQTLMDMQQAHSGQQVSQLSIIADNALLSDAAKSIAHRQKEREALRAAIREDITREDWDAAFRLIELMAQHYGYTEEAERFREEVEESRHDAIESKVNMAIEQVEELFNTFQWERARAEVRRLISLYPDHQRIAVLPDRLDSSFLERKEYLRQKFQEAADRKEVDRSIELIKELDTYLTPEEGRELEGVVRAIFQDKLDNMTIEFEMAVKDQNWNKAIEAARQIMDEYPNTRRAQELRDGVFDSLLKRAGVHPDQVKA